MPTPTRHPTSWLTAAVLVASLAACGGSDSPPDALQKYREQAVKWTQCDSTILGVPMDRLGTGLPYERLQCAQVRAPMDWSQPGRGDISLAVMRLAAGQPSARRGALLMNPGGPGGDGLVLSLTLWTAFADSNPASPQGAQQLRLLQEYDMVGFSPRGLGASTRLVCGTNELERFVDYSAAGWDTPGNIANIHYNGSKKAEACARNPLTPYINTDATARDMDLLRGLLGDDKLSYLGYSYGTWLGAWYASLFPEKVGRMVLDSSMDYSTSLEESMYAQPPARQRLFDSLLAPYAARHADFFHLGATEAQVRAAMPGLSSRVQAVLADSLSNLGYHRKNADPYLDQIRAAQGLDAALGSGVDAANDAAVHAALAQQVFHPADGARDTKLREAARQLYGSYRQTWLESSAQSIEVGDAVSLAVRCNDTPSTTSLTQWAFDVRKLARQAPMYFGGVLTIDACAFWGGPSVSKPDPVAMHPLPVLFVQSQYDSATNTDHADRFFDQLPAARRMYVTGDFQHGVYPYDDACVDPQVTAYLLGETPTQRETVCQGKPLERDGQGKPLERDGQGASNARMVQAADGAPPVYKNPEKARALIEEFKRGLARP